MKGGNRRLIHLATLTSSRELYSLIKYYLYMKAMGKMLWRIGVNGSPKATRNLFIVGKKYRTIEGDCVKIIGSIYNEKDYLADLLKTF